MSPVQSAWTFTPRPEAAKEIADSILGGVAETFQEDIVPEAQRESPKSAHHRAEAGRGGPNVSSIKSALEIIPEGVQATIYTDDGYGGFVEMGTKKMAAEPYIFPAFQKFIGGLPARISAKLKQFYG